MLRNFKMLRSCFIYFYEIGIIESNVIYAKILDSLILRFTILNYLVYIFIWKNENFFILFLFLSLSIPTAAKTAIWQRRCNTSTQNYAWLILLSLRFISSNVTEIEAFAIAYRNILMHLTILVCLLSFNMLIKD